MTAHLRLTHPCEMNKSIAKITYNMQKNERTKLTTVLY